MACSSADKNCVARVKGTDYVDVKAGFIDSKPVASLSVLEPSI